ncbi:MAG: chorismate lyase [Gammaproteobacteria bacterium]|nr:MAG: chorismate lyase [Gammaproteobacteria bacterium]
MVTLAEIQWTNRAPTKNNSFCSWLQKTTPVSQFLLEKLEQHPQYKLINSGYYIEPSGYYREAIIYNCDTPLIYAQTLFPKQLVDEIPKLTQLGDSSLGVFLLEHGQFHKESMDFGYLKKVEQLPAQIQGKNELQKCDSLLCRRSVLTIAGHKAKLIEVFLPGFEELFHEKGQ